MISYIVTGAVLAVLALAAAILASIIGPAEARGLHPTATSRCHAHRWRPPSHRPENPAASPEVSA